MVALMKKIILSIVGVLAVLWVALFVSGQQVLVWEETPSQALAECRQQDELDKEKGYKFLTEELFPDSCLKWQCTYFNGRRLITKEYSSSRTSCPNFRENR
jgi:hypothetical protein|tara:strand:- start:32 stop:334 length:303 start_codon:yes stop_codon:yes gene_type:complete